MKPGGYAELNRQLFSEAGPDLQVTPRRRLAGNVNITTVAGNVDASVSFAVKDQLLTAGDGMLIELALLELTTPGTLSMAVISAGFVCQLQGGLVVFPLGDVRSVVSDAGVQTVGSNLVLDFTPRTQFWTWLDLNALVGTPLTTANQPLALRFQMALTDANIETVTGRAVIFYRIVKGLQEG